MSKLTTSSCYNFLGKLIFIFKFFYKVLSIFSTAFITNYIKFLQDTKVGKTIIVPIVIKSYNKNKS